MDKVTTHEQKKVSFSCVSAIGRPLKDIVGGLTNRAQVISANNLACQDECTNLADHITKSDGSGIKGSTISDNKMNTSLLLQQPSHNNTSPCLVQNLSPELQWSTKFSPWIVHLWKESCPSEQIYWWQEYGRHAILLLRKFLQICCILQMQEMHF